MEWIAVFIGGGVGSVTRLGLNKWLGVSEVGFPWGTLAANLVACIVLGFVGGLLANKGNVSPLFRSAIAVGFCGGLSTFSTFSGESLGLFLGEKPVLAAVYVGISVVVCLLAVWVGQWLGRVVNP
jgi:fluoride exporter